MEGPRRLSPHLPIAILQPRKAGWATLPHFTGEDTEAQEKGWAKVTQLILTISEAVKHSRLKCSTCFITLSNRFSDFKSQAFVV